MPPKEKSVDPNIYFLVNFNFALNNPLPAPDHTHDVRFKVECNRSWNDVHRRN